MESWILLLIKFIFIGGVFTITLVIAMYSTYAERKGCCLYAGPHRAEQGRDIWYISTPG
jgi:hypothetical protein